MYSHWSSVSETDNVDGVIYEIPEQLCARCQQPLDSGNDPLDSGNDNRPLTSQGKVVTMATNNAGTSGCEPTQIGAITSQLDDNESVSQPTDGSNGLHGNSINSNHGDSIIEPDSTKPSTPPDQSVTQDVDLETTLSHPVSPDTRLNNTSSPEARDCVQELKDLAEVLVSNLEKSSMLSQFMTFARSVASGSAPDLTNSSFLAFQYVQGVCQDEDGLEGMDSLESMESFEGIEGSSGLIDPDMFLQTTG